MILAVHSRTLVHASLLTIGLLSTDAMAQSSKVILSEEAQLSLTSNLVIASPHPGIIASMAVKEGDFVREGDRLAQLDAEIAEAELVAAEAAYEAARLQSVNDVDRQFAIRSLEVRVKELEQSEIANRRYSGSVTDSELAKLRLVVEQSRLAIEQATQEQRIAEATADEKAAAMRIAQARLNKHRLLAPISGIVAEVPAEVGAWVEPGKPVVRLISLHPIRVECFVDGRQYGPELVGHRVEFRLEQSGLPNTDNDSLELATDELPSPRDESKSDKTSLHTGKVVFVSSELHPVTGQARIWAELENTNYELRAGMIGKLDVLEDKASNE